MLISLFLFIGLCVSCSSSETVGRYHKECLRGTYPAIGPQINADTSMISYIDPYRRIIDREINQVLGISAGPFKNQMPEGSLGNLIADIMRSKATSDLRRVVHVGILCPEMIGDKLSEGSVTVGNIYEVLPYDDQIVVVELSGKELEQLARDMAAADGAVISGMRFRIYNRKPGDILVGLQSIDPDVIYRVATTNRIADGGGSFPTLWNTSERIDLSSSLRGALIEYIRMEQIIEPYTDQRLRY